MRLEQNSLEWFWTYESGSYRYESGSYRYESGRYRYESGSYRYESGRYRYESGRYCYKWDLLLCFINKVFVKVRNQINGW